MKSFRVRLAFAVAALIVLAAPASAQADVVTDWNANANQAIFTVANQAPPVGALHLAMVQGAVYDAVNAIDRRHQPYLYRRDRVLPWTSKEAAAAAAAYRVLLHLFPSQQMTLTQQYEASLASIPEWAAKWDGIAIGEASADAMIANRTGDGRFGAPGFPTGNLPGQWRPVLPSFVNDPAGWVRNVRPFLVESADQFASPGPWPMDSVAYAMEFNEVKSVGQDTSVTRTADQTHAVLYWAESPVRTWNRILRNVSAQHGLSLVENARLFAIANMTTADAAITVWKDKARWGFWRPITAIREAHLDGNPLTTADPTWLPRIATPPYPDHPSGHLGVSTSMTEAMRSVLGTDAVSWTDTNVGGLTRSYSSLDATIEEIVGARIWSGIHFRRPDVASVDIAKGVAGYTHDHYFRPGRYGQFR